MSKNETTRTGGIDVQAFLQSIWQPGSGYYCIAALEKGFDSSGKEFGYYKHYVSDNYEDIIKKATDLSNAGKDVYFGIGTLKERYIEGENGRKHYRTAENIHSLKALFIDVDCGQGKPYANQEEGLKALDQFCEAIEFPDPLIVSSGFGLHVYWLFDEAVDPEEWIQFARRFKALTEHLKFDVDPSRTADKSSVLRFPDTYNFKKGQQRPVKILSREISTYPVRKLKEKVKVALKKYDLKVTLNEKTSDFDDLFKNTYKNLIDTEKLKRALSFIPYANHHLWINVLLAIKYELEEDGYDIFHEWCKGIANYPGPEEIRRVWDGAKPNGKKRIGSVFKYAIDNGFTFTKTTLKKDKTDTINTAPLYDDQTIDAVHEVPVGDALILPSDYFPYPASAKTIFPIISKSKNIFWRGGAIVETSEGEHGTVLRVIKAPEFQSRLDNYGIPVMKHRKLKDKVILQTSRCSRQDAEVLLATLEARDHLPHISLISPAPIIVEQNGKVAVLNKGYHSVLGGVLILGGEMPPTIPLAEAVQALKGLLRDYSFQTPSDKSRAIAMQITPALKMGGLLSSNTPIDTAEAKDSQSGKTHRQKCIRLIYRDQGYFISKKKGGVGSLDESIGSALMSGRAFIAIDNIRGKLDSEYLEAAITTPEIATARVPHRGEVTVDARRTSFAISSNGVETTRDLANRCCIIRLFKQPAGYKWYPWPEGSLEEHIISNQPYYLGCVHAVVRHWLELGKPVTRETRHDMRGWAQSLDWIVTNIFQAAPLLDGHQAAQERASNPNLNWLRSVCLAAERTHQLGPELSASAFLELCEDENITLPNGRSPADGADAKMVGQVLSKIFRPDSGGVVKIDAFTVSRMERNERDEANRKDITVKRYAITK